MPLAPLLARDRRRPVRHADRPRRRAHASTILGVAVVASCCRRACCGDVLRRRTAFNGTGLHLAGQSAACTMQVGFLIDRLTAMMMVRRDLRVADGARLHHRLHGTTTRATQRFFSYISLFTFSMLMLVMSNNFLQLFFGWEAVGLVSYLLIGFWYTRPTRDLRQPEGVPRQPRRRLRLHARHRPVVLPTSARSTTRDGVRQARRSIARRRSIVAAARDVVAADASICICLFIGAMGKSRAVAAARVAARLDGRPDADLGADPRRDDGDGRHLHGGAHVAAVRAVARPRCRSCS